ncbi:MAG TPA: aldehyde dehydrogenase (NADP(+)), partial [Bacteroidota bacterium]|nr:aldehyde dehydrogenase (NADP(+)) [Bacteroidota bacterium]
PGKAKGILLRHIAENLETALPDLVRRATIETGLPPARIEGETARTCYQLRMFAALIEEGSWVDARIDHADKERKPAAKPDIRSMMRARGPVGVFCASNFPVAFSVAGGDTASALAAGCPVIVNAHYGHPGTSEIAGIAIRDAVKKCGMPEGTFSLIFGAGNDTGAYIVRHPLIKAISFTGSRKGGLALAEIARTRPEPVPFYGELSSVNPVFILPGAMQTRGEEIAKGLFGSVTLGAGQYCTNPGLAMMEESPASGRFIEHLKRLFEGTQEYVLLTEGISRAYQESILSRRRSASVTTVAEKIPDTTEEGFRVGAALFSVDARTFLDDPALSEEVFGPSTLLVRHRNREELHGLAGSLEGHLTATIHGTDDELREYRDLISILETRVGRVIVNGFPTGVEVCPAMVHGGPYPATTDGAWTSVGTRAIYRYTRPVCYQDVPDTLLPPELIEGNPLGIARLVEGVMTVRSS